MKKRKKLSGKNVDGFGPKDAQRIRSAVRKVWRWSFAHKLVNKRCALPEGFARCEKCKARVPRIYVDHIENVGAVDSGFIARMFVSSAGLQGLCKLCHAAKTRDERWRDKDFY